MRGAIKSGYIWQSLLCVKPAWFWSWTEYLGNTESHGDVAAFLHTHRVLFLFPRGWGTSLDVTWKVFNSATQCAQFGQILPKIQLLGMITEV